MCFVHGNRVNISQCLGTVCAAGKGAVSFASLLHPKGAKELEDSNGVCLYQASAGGGVAERFREGFVREAPILLYHSTPGSRVIKKKKVRGCTRAGSDPARLSTRRIVCRPTERAWV